MGCRGAEVLNDGFVLRPIWIPDDSVSYISPLSPAPAESMDWGIYFWQMYVVWV